MIRNEDIVRCLKQAGESRMAAYFELPWQVDENRASLVEILDLDCGNMVPSLYYVPYRKPVSVEAHYRLLPLDGSGWKLRRKPRIRFRDSVRCMGDNEAKQLVFKTMSFVLANLEERSSDGGPPFRMWFSSLLAWRDFVNPDGRAVYRYMLSGFTGVFADVDQTMRWNTYVQGPVPWEEYRMPASALLLGIPHGVISRSEAGAVSHAEALLKDWSLAFAVFCRRASPAQYSGSTQVILDWRDVLDGVNQRWPGYSTLAEMM